MDEFESPSYGDKLAILGILHRICQFLTHQELRNVRQACRSWYVVASAQRKFRDSIGVFRATWMSEFVGKMNDVNSCHRWTGAYFKNMSFIGTSHFKDYWAIHQSSIRVLKFSKIKLKCNEMVNFLNELPAVEDLWFYNCPFFCSEYDQINHRRTVCLHADGLADLPYIPLTSIPPPRIRSFKLKKQVTFPLCILDLIIRRSTGTLEQFSLKDVVIEDETRLKIRPSDNELITRFQQLLRLNAENIRTIELSNIPNVAPIANRFTVFLGRFNVEALPQVREICLVQLPSSEGWSFQSTDNIIQFLLLMPTTVEKVKLGFSTRFREEALVPYLRTLTHIRSFTFNNSDLPLETRTMGELLQRYENLEEFESIFAPRRSWLRPVDAPQPDVRVSLRSRRHLQRLSLSFAADDFQNALSIRTLTSLRLHCEGKMEDGHARSLFAELGSLEELRLNLAIVTDIGFTGFTVADLQQLRNAQDENARLLIGNRARDRADQANVPWLGSLKKLRKLTLFGCVQTDISLVFGIRFEHLRDLDLSLCPNITDLGMTQLGLNNPALHRVILLQNPRVTRLGLNQLICARPTLVDVRSTKLICSTDTYMEGVQLHPRFNRIVSIGVKNERQAPPIEEA